MDIFRMIIIGIKSAVSDDVAVKPFKDGIYFRNFTIDDQGAVCRKKGSKLMEGAADMSDILEKVQMVFFHIEDNTYFREKA